MLEKYDYLYKIVLIGNSGVGKTNLLLRLSQGKFYEDTKPTIGVEFDAKTFTFDDAVVKAQIWDTAGQERYRAITSAYYRGTKGALLVYDVTRQTSLDDCLQYWLLELKKHSSGEIVIGLVGNKTDLKAKREISYDDGREVAEKNDMLFFETSALENSQVTEAFEMLMKRIYEKNRNLERSKLKKGIDPDILKGEAIKKLKKKKGGCC